jgi:hypothetical protein
MHNSENDFFLKLTRNQKAWKAKLLAIGVEVTRYLTEEIFTAMGCNCAKFYFCRGYDIKSYFPDDCAPQLSSFEIIITPEKQNSAHRVYKHTKIKTILKYIYYIYS